MADRKHNCSILVAVCRKKILETSPGFSAEVMAEPGGEHLNSCFSCGACSGACPVSQAVPDFDPRKIIHMIRMGMEERQQWCLTAKARKLTMQRVVCTYGM